MKTKPYKTPFRAFSDALIEVLQSGLTNEKECATAADCSRQTINNARNEFAELGVEKAKRLAKDHPIAEVRRVLATALLSGTEFQISVETGDTDADRDGRTTLKDAVIVMSEVMCGGAEEMKQLLAESGDGLTDEEAQRAIDGAVKLKAELSKFIGTVTGAMRSQMRLSRSG